MYAIIPSIHIVYQQLTTNARFSCLIIFNTYTLTCRAVLTYRFRERHRDGGTKKITYILREILT